MYVGPTGSGKATNLRYLHLHLGPAATGELKTESIDNELIVSFDFFAEFLQVATYTIFSVNGSIEKFLDSGVDGVVFVADSISNRMNANMAVLQELGNLAEHIPLVVQFNKRDHADALPLETMKKTLNTYQIFSREAVATEGYGVFSTSTAIIKRVDYKWIHGSLSPETTSGS